MSALDPREKQDRLIGWALFGVGFIVIAVTQSGVGIPRDESFYFLAASNTAAWYKLLWANASQAMTDNAIAQSFSYNSEHPVLMKKLFGLSYLILHENLGLTSAQVGFRIPAFAAAAIIPTFIYWMGARIYGRVAGVFAAVSFYLVPRQFFHAHLSCFDLPIAAAMLATIYAFWRAQSTKWGWLWTGLAFGFATATKHNALFLPLILTPLALWRAWRVSADSPVARRGVLGFIGLYAVAAFAFGFLVVVLASGSGTNGKYAELTPLVNMLEPLSPPVAIFVLLMIASAWLLWWLRPQHEATFRALAPVAAMAGLGPVLFYALWPYLWHHPVTRTADYLAFHATHFNYAWMYMNKVMREPPFPLEYVFAVTALTVPTSLMVPMATGLFALGGRCLLWATERTRAWTATPRWEEVVIACNALAPILLISAPSVPHFGGVKHWFTAMPFLALLGGAAVARAVEVLERLVKARRPSLQLPPWGVPAALCTLLFLPAFWSTASLYKYGTSAYAEISGGLPGAASLGLQRQFWSNNVTGVLPWINENARPNARVWLHEVTDYSFMDYQREGTLRKDLRIAHGPGEADIAAYQYHQEFREQEFSIWQAFGTTRPVTGLYLDETPQIVVYRRP